MPRWEYRVIDLGDMVGDDPERVAGYESVLNDLGMAGWELVSVTETEYLDMIGPEEDVDPEDDDHSGVAGTTIAYFKRELP